MFYVCFIQHPNFLESAVEMIRNFAYLLKFCCFDCFQPSLWPLTLNLAKKSVHQWDIIAPSKM